jgi:hypothetical protein
MPAKRQLHQLAKLVREGSRSSSSLHLVYKLGLLSAGARFHFFPL